MRNDSGGSVPEPSAPAGAPRGKDSDECQTCRHTRYYHGEDATQLPGCITTGCGCPAFVDSARGVQGGEATAPALDVEACVRVLAEFADDEARYAFSGYDDSQAVVRSLVTALPKLVAECSTARAALEERTRTPANEDEEYRQWVWELVHAPGSRILASQAIAGRVVVVDGRTDLDACEATAEACFRALWEESRGGASPGRISFVFTHRDPSSGGSGVETPRAEPQT